MLDMLLRGDFNITSAAAYLISSLFIIFLVLPIHEAAHAFTAVKLGDMTPKYSGRLSLNPFAHIDYLGSILIILFGFGWAKPVPVNSRNFKNPKGGMALTALAGPVSNLLVGFVFSFLYNLFYWAVFHSQITINSTVMYFIFYLLIYIVQINIYLAVFNLIPVPPLDGSRLLTAILPDRVYYSIMRYERLLMIFVLVLCYTGILSGPLSRFTSSIMVWFIKITSLPFGGAASSFLV